MGLLDQVMSRLEGGGGQQQVQQIANGQGNFADPSSPDHSAVSAMMSHVPPASCSRCSARWPAGWTRRRTPST